MRSVVLSLTLAAGFLALDFCKAESAQADRFETPAIGGEFKIFNDHLGYDSKTPKFALLAAVAGSPEPKTFELIRTDTQEVVFQGPLEPKQKVSDWGDKFYYRADFSSFAVEGSYKIRVQIPEVGTVESEVFRVGPALHFKQSFNKVLNYFYQSRAVTEPSFSWDSALRIVGRNDMNPVNLQGGWYDASGDLSKYLSHLSFANYFNPQQIPLTVWTLLAVLDMNSRLPQNSEDQGRRLLAEAQFGADYLVRLLSKEGYFYTSVFDKWTGDTAYRSISVPSEGSIGTQSQAVQAAFREGGGMAIAALARAARITAPFHMERATSYLNAAKIAWDHLQKNNLKYCDDGQENIIDDYTALLAATELALTSGEAGYTSAAKLRAQQLMGRLSAAGYFFSDSSQVKPEQRGRPFFHASDAGLPLIALARYLELELAQDEVVAVKAAIKKNLDYQLSVNREVANPFNYARQHFRHNGQVQSGFFIPHENETTYWWQGENARLGSLAAAALIAGQKVYATDAQGTLPKDLLGLAGDQVAWILGKNPYDVSFAEGIGRNNSPAYSVKKQGHGHLVGGISNGITGKQGNGSGIAWNPAEANPPLGQAWENWRWVEQWLPHSTWYLLAIASMAELEATSL